MEKPKAAAVAVKKSTIAIGKGAAAAPGKAVDEVHYTCERVCCAGWCTRWGATDEQRPYWPPRHSDFRDMTPQQLSRVYELYQPVVEDGRWTEGLCEMWWRKNKPVKHSVHIPCWDSFKWNPLKWRGYCFGRTVRECYWTGNRQMRWTRAVYAANLGREYVMPVRNIGKHGYKSDLKALCCMYFLMSCIFSCGIGQVATCCGSGAICNFGAWFSCHARERLRRRYKLPPLFGLPPGIDDCLVHFFCFYCASHQETRELAIRGVDGPGMHIFDVLPNSFPFAPGIEEAKAARKQLVEQMVKKPPKIFSARGCKETQAKLRQRAAEQGGVAAVLKQRVADAAADYAEGEESDDDVPLALERVSAGSSVLSAGSSEVGLGWVRYCPPATQEMERGPSGGALASPSGASWAHAQAAAAAASAEALRRHSAHSVPVLEEQAPDLTRWSVAY